MSFATTAVPDREQLTLRIREALPQLSRQFEVIGQYVLHHADYLAGERIQDVARRCGVQPSAVVRFAKHFGLNGFLDLKLAFSDEPVSSPRRDYRSRVRPLLDVNATSSMACAEVAFTCMDAACAGVQALQRGIRAEDLRDAITTLAQADVLWIAGARRSFPVAAYLAYALQGLSKPVQLVSFTGAMHEGQLRGLRSRDAVIAISFAPYAEETLHALHVARSVGAPVVSITDDLHSPVAAEARISLVAPDSTPLGFRELTNAMTLAHSLFVALAFQLECQASESLNP